MNKIVAVLVCLCCFALVSVTPVPAADNLEQSEQVEALLDVNAATASELISLPGIGKVTAERIVAYRNEQGAFATVDDLMQVKGVGKKVLEKIRPFITVGS